MVRLEGTNAEQAHGIIANAGIGDRLLMADSLKDAAQKSVRAVS